MDINKDFNKRHSVCANTAFALINAAKSANANAWQLAQLMSAKTCAAKRTKEPEHLPRHRLPTNYHSVPALGIAHFSITLPVVVTMEIPPLSTGQAGRALQLLTANHAARLDQLADFAPDSQATESESDEDISDCPRMDTFLESGGSGAVLQMTNFSLHEFNAVWEILREDVVATWNTGRGRRCGVTPKDTFFMMLTTLKHAGNWEYNGKMFGIKGSTFERQVLGFMAKVVDKLKHIGVKRFERKYTMERLMHEKQTFGEYAFCLYATDVTFQCSNRPVGNHQESQKYFSNKHKLYGYKTEVSVLPNGLAIGSSIHHPGSVSDIAILRHNLLWHKDALKKTEAEMNTVLDIGTLREEFEGQWGVIMDKGYQGSCEFIRAVLRKKTPKGGFLTAEEERQNRRKAGDRIIVENWFGRLSTLWAVMGNRWRWDERHDDMMFTVCMALTNLHIKWHLLRDEDCQRAKQYTARILEIGIKTAEKRRASQQRYRAKRRACLSAEFGDTLETDPGVAAMMDLLNS